MTVFFSQLINGLSLGSIYALIALGYSMVYGIILLLNFAHGDVIMVGAYMSWFVMNQLGLGPVTAVCAAINHFDIANANVACINGRQFPVSRNDIRNPIRTVMH